MKSAFYFLFFLGLSFSGFSQERQELPFRGFRGNQLKAFDASQFSTNEKHLAPDASSQRSLIIHSIPGDSYFLINSHASYSAVLYNEAGLQLQEIKLQAGENHIDLYHLSPGVYSLREVAEGRLLATLIHTN